MSDWTKPGSGSTASATRTDQKGSGGKDAQEAKETATKAAQDVKETAKQTMDETKTAAMDTAQQIKGDVQAQASEVADEAKQQATEIVGQAKEQASHAFADQQQQAVSSLGSLSEALRKTAKGLKEGDDPAQAGIANFVEDAAERLGRSADFLRDKDPGQLLHDVQDFAKKQPLAFVGAAFGIGIFAARMMKGGAGSAQMNEMVGSLSKGATEAMDTVKERVGEMTGSSDDSGKSGQSGQSSGSGGSSQSSGTSQPSKASASQGSSSGAAAGGMSTSSSPAADRGNFGRMDETASDFEVGQARGDAGTSGGTTTSTTGYGTGASAGYSPSVPGMPETPGREGRS